MGTDASIAMSVKDNLSQAIVGMKNSVTNFRSDITALQDELDHLNATRVQMRMDLSGATQEAKRTKKAFEELGDSATEAERKAAEADWRQAEENLDNIRQQYDLVSRQVRQTTRDMENASGAISRMENRAGPGSTGVLAALGKAGILNMAGDAAGQWANTLVGSAFGSEVGGLFGGALGGAVQGAAMGSLAGPVGTAVGAAVGGGIGLLTGGAQAFSARDDAFKAYYTGVYDTQSEAMQQNQSAGSLTASQRQLDEIAFNRLLGKGSGTQYLEDLRALAADTPMEYGDLTTMSRALATGFGNDPSRMLALMTGIGNAGSAVGVDAQGMATMSQAMSRMQSSNKASLEYLNVFQERGIDVIGMLGEALGKDQGQVYDMISKGSISGTQAVDIIEEGLGRFAGAMDEMSKTFEGRTSTLSDTMAEIYNAGGASYNQSRSEAMAQEIEAYGGSLGEAMKEAYDAIGAGKAAMENLGEAYTRDARSAVMEGSTLTQEWDASTAARLTSLREQYKSAMEDFYAGDDSAGLKVDEILKAADGLAQQQFEASDLYKADLDAQAESLEALRENTAAVRAAAGIYGLSQERTKGLSSGVGAVSGGSNPQRGGTSTENDYVVVGNLQRGGYKLYSDGSKGYAFGLDRVPRNGLYYLHENERVSTAREAGEQDRGRKSSLYFDIHDNNFGAGVSADEIAQRLADQIELHLAAGVVS